MNREIKFRAWNVNKNIMLRVIAVYENGLNATSDNQTYTKEESILMEFTGFLDKNDVEVYEGDIVIHHIHLDFSVIKTVEFFNGCFILKSDGIKRHKSSNLGNANPSYTVEVIGNIYENKELLELS